MTDDVFLWIARLVIYAFIGTTVYFLGKFSERHRLKAKLPHHQHRPVEGCLRCQIDKYIDA